MTPYYQDDACTIYHGDCLEVMGSFDQQFDMVFTSPPYNLGVSTGGGIRGGRWGWSDLASGYEDYDDAMDPAEYITWQRQCLNAMWLTLSETGAIFYNHKPRVQAGELQVPLNFNPGLPLRQIVIWVRKGGFNYNDHFFLPNHEWIVVIAKPHWRLKSKAAATVGDVWQVAQKENTPHPAPFPLQLPARAIEAAGPSTVLDPFMGSGTTLVAAKAAGVHAVGIEISERYCEIAAKRLAQEVLDFAVLTGQEPRLTGENLRDSGMGQPGGVSDGPQ